MLSVRRLVVAFAAATALLMCAGASAQASWTITRASPIQPSQFCTGAYATVAPLRFQACVVVNTLTGGAWAQSQLRVANPTSSARRISGRVWVVVTGRVQPLYNCGDVVLPAGAGAICTGPRSFVLKSPRQYAYGRTWIHDYSSGRSSFGYSPVYRP
jgi:hypothetical protein